MAVLRNRRPPRMHPGCADPLLKFIPVDLQLYSCTRYTSTAALQNLYLLHVMLWSIGLDAAGQYYILCETK
jgi:hypothetical protein